MRNIALTDDSFESSVFPDCHLSIQYCGQFCTFAVLDTVRNRYIALKHFWFDEPVPVREQGDQLQSVIRGESFLMHPFRTVSFMYLSPDSVLVPTALFMKENPGAYFRFSAGIRPTDQVLYRRIPRIDAYSLFAVPDGVVRTVGLITEQVRMFHQSCPQISDAMAEPEYQSEPNRVLACVNPGFVDVTVIRSGQLVLHNSYHIKNTNDLIFFILYMYEQFGLPQAEAPVLLSGFLELYPGAAEFLYRYIQKTVIRDFPRNYSYGKSFSELSPYHFSPLFNLATCE